MKNAADIAKNMLKDFEIISVVEFQNTMSGWEKLLQPTMSSNLKCKHCESSKHYVTMIHPITDHRKVWICGNPICLTVKASKGFMATSIPPKSFRAIQWRLWCEINGIGDVHHDVKFEGIQQSTAKMEYLLKFANAPQGFLVLQGTPGSGKTFSALAVCELFTRKSHSCIFTTQRKMLEDWLISRKEFNNFKDRMLSCTLLVIDDFGLTNPDSAFLEFIFEVLNSRMQWKNKGTILTTHLTDEQLQKYCGPALADRLASGDTLEFTNKSRRREKIQ